MGKPIKLFEGNKKPAGAGWGGVQKSLLGAGFE